MLFLYSFGLPFFEMTYKTELLNLILIPLTASFRGRRGWIPVASGATWPIGPPPGAGRQLFPSAHVARLLCVQVSVSAANVCSHGGTWVRGQQFSQDSSAGKSTPSCCTNVLNSRVLGIACFTFHFHVPDSPEVETGLCQFPSSFLLSSCSLRIRFCLPWSWASVSFPLRTWPS